MTEPAGHPDDDTDDDTILSCDFCGWFDHERSGWVEDRPARETAVVPTDPGHGPHRLCGFCDISETVSAWLDGCRPKPFAIIDQMRGFNLLRADMFRVMRDLGNAGKNEENGR